tara:strand:- start:1221 stop:1487 length:267 start_codon:yes stop_codon:yes gene_type:complete
MPDEIELVRKGYSPTLLHTEKANELIRAVNALLNLSVISGDSNQVINSGDQIVISINKNPPGFFEKEIEICESGVVKTYVMLVRGPIT